MPNSLKTINERVDVHDSSDDDVVEKDVAYLAKNFRKILKFKNSGKFGDKGKIPKFRKEEKGIQKERWKRISIYTRCHLF